MRSANPYMSPQTGYPREFSAEESWTNRSALWLLFSFRGRIPRIAFWSASFVVACVHYGTVYLCSSRHWTENQPLLAAFIVLPVLIVTTWSNLAISTKRWHDRNKSGWWFFINFVPLLGFLWALVETGFLRGTYGQNAYGPDSV